MARRGGPQRVEAIQPQGEEFPALGQVVTVRTAEGHQSGQVTARVTVGDLRSYDVRCGGVTLVVSPSQIVGHRDYREEPPARSA